MNPTTIAIDWNWVLNVALGTGIGVTASAVILGVLAAVLAAASR